MVRAMQTPPQLHWLPTSIEKIMYANGIQDRKALAEDIHKFCQLGRATIYRAFDDTWGGNATHTVLAALQQRFNVPLDLLATSKSG